MIVDKPFLTMGYIYDAGRMVEPMDMGWIIQIQIKKLWNLKWNLKSAILSFIPSFFEITNGVESIV